MDNNFRTIIGYISTETISIGRIFGNVSREETIIGNISSYKQLQGSLQPGTVSQEPVYEGEYEVESDAYEDKIMLTQNHKMKNNVTIKRIPYEEVQNQSGTTVSISS